MQPVVPTDGAVIGAGAATAAAILDAAAELFSTAGYDGTSTRQIAKAVGIQAASLYNHFASKEEILHGVVQRATLELDAMQHEAVAAATGATARLSSFIRTHVRYHATHARDAKIANVHMYTLTKQNFTLIAQFRDRYEQMLQDILREGAGAGEFQILDPKLTSYALLQMGIGVAYWFSPGGPVTVEDLCDTYESFTFRIVSGKEGIAQ